MTELAGLRSYDNLSMTDVVLSSFGAEDLEAASRYVVEATSCMDRWKFAVKSMVFHLSENTRMLKHLFVGGARSPASCGQDCFHYFGLISFQNTEMLF